MAVNDKREVTAYIVDAETGAVRQTMRKGDRFVPMRIFEQCPDKDYTRIPGSFVKVPGSALAVLEGLRLSSAEWRCFWLLCGRVVYASGIVRHKNGKPLRLHWISAQLGLTPKSTRRVLDGLQRAGLIVWVKLDSGLAIRINPFACYRGQVVECAAVEDFSGTDFARNCKEGQ